MKKITNLPFMTRVSKVKSWILRRKNDFLFSTRYSKQGGFTLIELVVAIGVLAILAGLSLTILNPVDQFKKAQDARRKSDIGQIQKAIEQYYQDTGHYPSSQSYNIVGQAGVVSFGGNWSPYLSTVPSDPESGKRYVYYAPTDLQSYYLYASLDETNDAQACNKGNACTSLSLNSVPSSACGTGYICNYGVSSPNVSP